MPATRPRLVPAEPGHKCRCGADALTFDLMTGYDECEEHLPVEALPGGREVGGYRLFVHPSEFNRRGHLA